MQPPERFKVKMLYNSETDLVFANVFKRAGEAMYQNKTAMKALVPDQDRRQAAAVS